MALFYIGIAGTAGAICRMLLSRLLVAREAGSFPWGTFACNMIGSVLLGLLSFAVINRLPKRVQIAVNTGFIGSFTTFSAFSMETVLLLQEHAYAAAILYAAGSLLGGLACCWAGIRLGAFMNVRLGGRLSGEGGGVRE